MKLGDYRKFKQVLDTKELSECYNYKFRGTAETEYYLDGKRKNYRILLEPQDTIIYSLVDLMAEIVKIDKYVCCYANFRDTGFIKLH